MLEFTKIDTIDSKAIQLVRSLNPKPGNIISESLRQEHIIPDIIISKKDGKWLTELNTEINPKIRINKTYQKLIQDIPSGKDREYVKTHFQDAKFFLKALQNRNITILKVAKIIFQKTPTRKNPCVNICQHFRPIKRQRRHNEKPQTKS